MNRILIFDDDADILKICTIILQSKGYAVCTETSCENLLEKIRKHEPDLIIMDNKIPDIGGIAATRLIRQTESFKNLPVIFFSAYGNVAQLSKQAGADHFLEKPFDMTELEKLVEAVAGSRVVH